MEIVGVILLSPSCYFTYNYIKTNNTLQPRHGNIGFKKWLGLEYDDRYFKFNMLVLVINATPSSSIFMISEKCKVRCFLVSYYICLIKLPVFSPNFAPPPHPVIFDATKFYWKQDCALIPPVKVNLFYTAAYLQ